MTLWQYDEARHGWKNNGLMSKTYPNIELYVRGGVRCKKGLTWFFKSLYHQFTLISLLFIKISRCTRLGL